MIKLRKLPEPEILKARGAEWLRVLEDKENAGEVASEAEKGRYRHAEIKAVLKFETHGKCAYCESRLLHIAFGDVEHISPKSRRLSETFRWDNLTLACDVCNTYKGSIEGIVDPYVDNPEDIFRFVGPMIYARPISDKAIVSVHRLRLNRAELIQSRTKRLAAIASIIATIISTNSEDVRSAIVEDLINNEASDAGEYSAFVKSFINVVGDEIGIRI